MRSLGTFPPTPIACKKLCPSGAKKQVSSAHTDNCSATSDIFDKPVTDHGRRHDRSSEDHLSPCSKHLPIHSSCKCTASWSLSPAPAAKKGKVSKWHNDQAPQGCAKAQDYKDTVYHGIVQACHNFEAWIGASGAWPDPEEQIMWARDAWDIVCKDISEQYELTKRMLGSVGDSPAQVGSMLMSLCRSRLTDLALVVMSKILFARRIPFGAIRRGLRCCSRTMLSTTRYHSHISWWYPTSSDQSRIRRCLVAMHSIEIYPTSCTMHGSWTRWHAMLNSRTISSPSHSTPCPLYSVQYVLTSHVSCFLSRPWA